MKLGGYPRWPVFTAEGSCMSGCGCGHARKVGGRELSRGQQQLKTRDAFLPNTHEDVESNPDPSDFKAHYLSDIPCPFPKS